MSRIRANTITNQNANGAPNFPDGITVTGVITATSISQTLSGDLSVTGNLGIGGTTTSTGAIVASGGVDFSATGDAAGMTSELLDDYEEGTWTANLIGSTGNPSTTISSTAATYTKVGRMVTVWFDITVTSGGTSGSGAPYITELPFVSLYGSGSGNNNGGYGAPQFRDMTLTHSNMRIYGNSSYLSLIHI